MENMEFEQLKTDFEGLSEDYEHFKKITQDYLNDIAELRREVLHLSRKIIALTSVLNADHLVKDKVSEIDWTQCPDCWKTKKEKVQLTLMRNGTFACNTCGWTERKEVD